MYNLLFTILMLCTTILTFAQSDTTTYITYNQFLKLENSVNELKLTTNGLKKNNAELQRKNEELLLTLNRNDSLEYAKIINSILFTIDKSDALEQKFINIMSALTKDPIFVNLARINNPTSDSYGFKFSELIIKLSEKILEQSLPTQELKGRWSRVVDNLINDKYINAFINSNPVTGIISNIVSSAASFIDIVLDDKKVKNIKPGFEKEVINKFMDEIKPYLEYYESLNIIGEKYLHRIEQIKEKYSHLNATAKNFHSQLILKCNLDKNINIALTEQFRASLNLNYDKNGFLDYRSAINNQMIKNALEHVNNFEVVKVEVQNLKEDYTSALSEFLSDYLDKIKYAKILFGDIDKFDPTKIESLIRDIENLQIRINNAKTI